jgi:hypothetical protein
VQLNFSTREASNDKKSTLSIAPRSDPHDLAKQIADAQIGPHLTWDVLHVGGDPAPVRD